MGPVTFDAHSRDYLLITKDRVSCGIMKPWDPNDPRGYNGRENVYTREGCEDCYQGGAQNLVSGFWGPLIVDAG